MSIEYRKVQPGYWAVIPADVRYDKELPPSAKLLYAEISALTNRMGYCWMSNDYLADLFGVSAANISRLVSVLCGHGYLRIEGSGRARRIYLTAPEASKPPAEEQEEPTQNCSENLRKIAEVHKGRIINKLNNTPLKPPQGGGREVKAKKAPLKEPAWCPEAFAALWRAYPRGENKQRAMQAWDKLRPDGALAEEMGRALRRQKATEEWQRGIGIPYLSTWLNQRRWEDEDRGAEAAPAGDPGEEGLEEW